jgi:hypothetical protein
VKSRDYDKSQNNAKEIKQDISKGGIATRNEGLMNLVGDGYPEGNPSGDKRMVYWVYRVKSKRQEREDEQNTQDTIKRDVEEAIRIKSCQIGNHRRIGKKEDSENV